MKNKKLQLALDKGVSSISRNLLQRVMLFLIANIKRLFPMRFHITGFNKGVVEDVANFHESLLLFVQSPSLLGEDNAVPKVSICSV